MFKNSHELWFKLALRRILGASQKNHYNQARRICFERASSDYPQQASAFFIKALRNENADAFCALGIHYDSLGEFTPKLQSQYKQFSKFCFKLAAKKGHPFAQTLTWDEPFQPDLDISHVIDHFKWPQKIPYQATSICDKPHILKCEKIITDLEIQYLQFLAKNQYALTQVYSEKGTHYSFERTCAGVFFESKLFDLVAAWFDERLSSAFNLPIENGEPFQLLHYSPYEEFSAHYDTAEHVKQSSPTTKGPGHRIATVLVYCNSVPESAGGATEFPLVNFKVQPQKYSAIMFRSRDDQGRLVTESKHTGSLLKEGDKYVISKWLRERPMQRTFTP